MHYNHKRRPLKRIALALSLLVILIWMILGTGTSLAWFTDTSNELQNIFHVADFDLDVSYRLPDGSYAPLEGSTEVFDREALYEPGYVQVVYLKVENKGDLPFRFQSAVHVTDYTVAYNIYGQPFHLQDYLRFGMLWADTEAEIDALTANRELSERASVQRLNHYATEEYDLAPGQSDYFALIVRMPKEVDNAANYRGNDIPRVILGMTVRASQIPSEP